MKKLFAILLAVTMTVTLTVQTFAMQIFVKNDSKTITLEVEPTTIIADIKAKMQEKEGIPPELQKLFWKDTELSDDSKTLQYYGIEKESTLKLSAISFNSPMSSKNEGTYFIGVSGTYQAGTSPEEKISVDIAWESMSFTYTAGNSTYEPSTHKTTTTDGSWSTNKPGITVKNHSNVAIDATVSFTAGTGVTTTGTFYTKNGENYTKSENAAEQKLSLDSATGKAIDTDESKDETPKATLYFGVSGDAISENKILGTITVKIEKGPKIVNSESELKTELEAIAATGGTVKLGADITLTKRLR